MLRSSPALLLIIATIGPQAPAQAQTPETERRTKIEIDVTTVKSTRELPRLMYIVPWQDTNIAEETEARKIIIHDLFGDFYQPMAPAPRAEQPSL